MMSACLAESCYHCGLNVPANSDFSITVDNTRHAMCCPGCAAVAEAIFSGGLANFYQFRSAPSSKIAQNMSTADALNGPTRNRKKSYADWDIEEIQRDYILETGTVETGTLTTKAENASKTRSACLYIDNISCAACTWLIEKHLSKLQGIERVAINGTTHRGDITWRPESLKLSEILSAIEQIGYDASPIYRTDDQPAGGEGRRLMLRLGVAGMAMMQAGMVAIGLYAGSFQGMESEWKTLLRVVSLLFVTPVVFYSAQPFFSHAWRSLKMGHLVMDVPVALAIALAYSASLWATLSGGGEVYFDSIAMFTFFLLLGRFAEQRIREKNRLALNRGTQLPPVVTQVFPQRFFPNPKSDRIVAVKALVPGDFIRVDAGQIIPCDGDVEEGASQVSEALLTGESQPLDKCAGEPVFAGTVNGANPLVIKVTAIGQGTTLSAILALAEAAALEKPHWAMLADRLAAYFIAALLLIAGAVASYWAWHDPARALWITLSVLVVTCPCALSLATPTALTVASSVLRRQGFLINRAHVLEGLAAVDGVVFDKTGTLTEGNLSITAIQASAAFDGPHMHENIVGWAAALERGSQHPIAVALCRQAEKNRPSASTCITATAQDFVTGCGVRGRIDGEDFYLGRPDWVCAMAGLKRSPIPIARNSDAQQAIEIGFARAGEWIAALYFSDQLRSSATAAVNQLRAQGLAVSLLSGDPSPAAAAIVAPLQLTDYQFALRPEQKLSALRARQQQGHRLLMVGDGINDVPVLQAADVSVALGQASDLSLIHADATLLGSDLRALPMAVATAIKTRRIIRQNIGWALGYNLIALPLAAMGYVPPWAAAIGMSSSSLLVMLNALRLARGEVSYA